MLKEYVLYYYKTKQLGFLFVNSVAGRGKGREVVLRFVWVGM